MMVVLMERLLHKSSNHKSAPSLSTIEIIPDQMIYADSTLQCTATGDDFDGRCGTYRWTDSLGTQLADSEYIDCYTAIPLWRRIYVQQRQWILMGLRMYWQQAYSLKTHRHSGHRAIICMPQVEFYLLSSRSQWYQWWFVGYFLCMDQWQWRSALFVKCPLHDHNTMDVGDAITCTASTSDVQRVPFKHSKYHHREYRSRIGGFFFREEYYSNSLVTCSASATDIEGHSIELSYRFFRMDDEWLVRTEQTLQLSPISFNRDTLLLRHCNGWSRWSKYWRPIVPYKSQPQLHK